MRDILAILFLALFTTIVIAQSSSSSTAVGSSSSAGSSLSAGSSSVITGGSSPSSSSSAAAGAVSSSAAAAGTNVTSQGFLTFNKFTDNNCQTTTADNDGSLTASPSCRNINGQNVTGSALITCFNSNTQYEIFIFNTPNCNRSTTVLFHTFASIDQCTPQTAQNLGFTAYKVHCQPNSAFVEASVGVAMVLASLLALIMQF